MAIQLSHMLFDPIMDELDHRRILIVADGPLHFVPFAALSDLRTDQLLAVSHEVVNTPSASTLSVLRKEIAQREAPTKTIAVFADPIFEMEDERMKPSTFSDDVRLSTCINSNGRRTINTIAIHKTRSSSNFEFGSGR